MSTNKKYAVVTTDKRGVFFGELVKHSMEKKTATLKNAQMCVYWSRETKGILGLASHGPQKGSKVTPVIPKIEVNDVTAVMHATSRAVKEWQKEKW